MEKVDLSQIRSRALDIIKNNKKFLFLIFVLSSMGSSTYSNANMSYNDEIDPAIYIGIIVAIILSSIPLSILSSYILSGFKLLFLKLFRGEDTKLGHMVDMYKDGKIKTYAVSFAMQMGYVLLFSIPTVIIICVLFVPAIVNEDFYSFDYFLFAYANEIAISIALMGLYSIVTYIAFMRLNFITYVAYDSKLNTKGEDVFKLTGKLLNGRKMTFFSLDIVFLLAYILIISLCVGLGLICVTLIESNPFAGAIVGILFAVFVFVAIFLMAFVNYYRAISYSGLYNKFLELDKDDEFVKSMIKEDVLAKFNTENTNYFNY